ncbi:MAG: ABC transporter ATP-binding protein [Candidatus Tectimicrobiota bacterium]|nr:MAG: ABC transporter ATP-binding protein [Candidatus Tectomicrobia bacterium]
MKPLLEARGLQRRFGELVAVSGVDLRLARGEIRALIGPNGAGKTTLANLITGRLAPSAGRLFFAGREITRWRAQDRVRLGIVATFQIPAVLRNLTVFDNVALAAQRLRLRRLRDFFCLRASHLSGPVAEVLARVGLQAAWQQPAGSLAYGHQRLLELAMALALRPALLVLDEPTQGLTPEEIEGFVGLVREVAREATVLLIEHNMPVVLSLAHRVTVLDRGRVVFEGTPAEVEAAPAVQQLYLGVGEA